MRKQLSEQSKASLGMQETQRPVSILPCQSEELTYLKSLSIHVFSIAHYLMKGNYTTAWLTCMVC